MFAVVDIAGQQFNVEENTKYYVPRLENDVDTEVTFESVLLFNDGKKINQFSSDTSPYSVSALSPFGYLGVQYKVNNAWFSYFHIHGLPIGPVQDNVTKEEESNKGSH